MFSKNNSRINQTLMTKIQDIEAQILQDKTDPNRYQQAIEDFSTLLAQDPFNYLLYRHRGHRYLSASQYFQAKADLEMDCRLNPYYWKSWYYLGMISYYFGDFKQALDYFALSKTFIGKDTNYLPAITNWKYLCLCHLGLKDDPNTHQLLASQNIPADKITGVYPNLLLLHKGLLSVDQLQEVITANKDNLTAYISLSFGLALYYYFNDDTNLAKQLMKNILAQQAAWYTLAYKACQADNDRLFG